MSRRHPKVVSAEVKRHSVSAKPDASPSWPSVAPETLRQAMAETSQALTPIERAAQAVERAVIAELDKIPGGSRADVLGRLVALVHSASRWVVAARNGKITDTKALPDDALALAAIRELNALRGDHAPTRMDVRSYQRIEELHGLAVRFESLPDEELKRLAGFVGPSDGLCDPPDKGDER